MRSAGLGEWVRSAAGLGGVGLQLMLQSPQRSLLAIEMTSEGYDSEGPPQ